MNVLGTPKTPIWLVLVLLWMAAFPVRAAQSVGSVVELAGRADVTRGAAAAQPLAPGDPLYAQDTVRTKSASRLVIGLRDGSRLTLDENTRLALARYAADAEPEGLIDVLRGRVRALVGELFSSRSESFRMRTPTAILGVQGTDFVTTASQLATRVEVHAGLVSVANVDPAVAGRVLLRANQFSIVRRGEPPTPPEATGGQGSGSTADLRSDGLQSNDPLSLTPGGVPSVPLPPLPNPPRP